MALRLPPSGGPPGADLGAMGAARLRAEHLGIEIADRRNLPTTLEPQAMTRSLNRLLTRSNSRQTTTRRRLPWWIRRSVRAWTRLTRWPRPRPVYQVLDLGMLELGEEPGAAADERRCGWFDSSQDLREGLCVDEHDNDSPVAAQLPVMAWVQLQLSGWRPHLESAQA